jgi:YidC/Oxa1 family membrane protein insertase
VIGDIFSIVLLDPMVNFLVLLNNVLFGSFGLAIIAFTIIIRLATWPLTIRQLHATRRMQTLQPRIAEINKKYSDPKRRQQEVMALYKEGGVNPLGCVGPMLLQFPILIALFYAIRHVLPESPEALERLADDLYPWHYIQHAIPISDRFLSMDLKANSNIVMVLLVAATTFLQTKSTATVTTDDKARAQQQMMAYMMPVMFGFFALSFPNGVSLYWIVNSIVGIGFNIAVYGFAPLNLPALLKSRAPKPPPERAAALATAERVAPAEEPRITNAISRSKRQNRRRRP